MPGNFKRGSSRGGRGGFKSSSSFAKKRSSPNDDDDTPQTRTSKKARSAATEGDDEDATTTPLIPKLEKDNEGNAFISLKENGTRRITISEFKAKTFVSIREYYADEAGEMKPGKKGISLSIEQYNTLLAAAPLIESVLVERKEKVVRPGYSSKATTPPPDQEDEGQGYKEEREEENAGNGEDNEEEESGK